MRRSKNVGTTAILRVADLEVDTTARTVRRAQRGILLSAREYAILECLILRRDRVVSREALLETVYDGDDVPESNVLEVFIGTLRRKIDRKRSEARNSNRNFFE